MNKYDKFRKLVEEKVTEEERIYIPENDPLFYKNIIENGICDLDSFLSIKLPERPYYLKPWLRAGTLAMVYAARGVGKTWFAMMLMIAIVRNLSIGAWDTIKPVDILYLDGEMLASDLQQRFRKLSKDMSEVLSNIYIISSDLFVNNNCPAPLISNNLWREGIFEFLSQNKNIKVLILDNISSLTPGTIENDKQEWDEINQWLLRLRFLGVAVILIHHAGKTGDQRGTSGREDNLDVVIKLKRPSGYQSQDGAKFEVEFTKARGVTGTDLDPFTIELKEVEGKIEWFTEKTSISNERLIVALLASGYTQTETVSLLKVDKGFVSRKRKKAIRDGFLTTKNKFTDAGKLEYGDVDVSRFEDN